jgi:HD-like signal output (HDOD) protein
MSISQLIDNKELKAAQKIINSCNIPSPPQRLLNIQNELSLPEPDINKVNRLITEDIGLAAKILKTINSPLYKLSAKIESIEHAVQLLGIKKVKNFIINPAYHQALEQSFAEYTDFTDNAHQVGTLAEFIAHEVKVEPLPSVFYLAGLFHNVGALIMSIKFTDYLQLHKEKQINPVTWPLFEKDRYGVRHTSIGVLLAKHWGLTNTICNAIYLHHAIIPTYRNLIDSDSVTMGAILSLSIYMIDKYHGNFDIDQSLEYGILYDTVIKELMINEDTLRELEKDAQSIF